MDLHPGILPRKLATRSPTFLTSFARNDLDLHSNTLNTIPVMVTAMVSDAKTLFSRIQIFHSGSGSVSFLCESCEDIVNADVSSDGYL